MTYAAREVTGGQLEIITKSELDRIHGATVELLERLGIKVWDPGALKLFEDAGAEVDPQQMVVRIHEPLLKETIARAPSEFVLHGREPDYRLRMGERKVHFSVAGQSVNVQDLEGRIRPAVLKDAHDLARLADWCGNIHHVSVMTTPSDVPDGSRNLRVLMTNWANSVKTTDGYNYGRELAMDTVEMASILRGGLDELGKTPTLLGFTNPLSPMQLSKELTEGSIIYATHNQPVLYASAGLSGGTAPVTLGGVLVQQNAEVLSGVMVSQLARAGAPVLYGTASATMDMRTGASVFGGIETGLLNLASAQLARYYGIPSRGTGGNTDSKLVDAQAGLEAASTLLIAALAGMDFIYDAAGSIEGTVTISYEKLMVDNEICGMVMRVLEGFDLSEESLAVDEICRVGHSASFLASPMTRRLFRREHYLPMLLDRRSRDAWERLGAKDLSTVAREKAAEVLRTYEPEPMDRGVLKELELFVREREKKLAH